MRRLRQPSPGRWRTSAGRAMRSCWARSCPLPTLQCVSGQGRAAQRCVQPQRVVRTSAQRAANHHGVAVASIRREGGVAQVPGGAPRRHKAVHDVRRLLALKPSWRRCSSMLARLQVAAHHRCAGQVRHDVHVLGVGDRAVSLDDGAASRQAVAAGVRQGQDALHSAFCQNASIAAHSRTQPGRDVTRSAGARPIVLAQPLRHLPAVHARHVTIDEQLQHELRSQAQLDSHPVGQAHGRVQHAVRVQRGDLRLPRGLHGVGVQLLVPLIV
mmetsp:Transcript_17789/g.44874  ORF Transcript_17789/g.44874 Transcript_17789/m.44874 type:complete len:270 (+) Transcript_17789:1-810(+)